MRRVAILVTLLVLGGCSQESDPTYTVDELTADATLLDRIVSQCRNDPGKLRDTPNCRNAEAADGKLRLQNMRKALGG